ncbi:MAG: serine/threonine protein kinase [Amycolatopsis sp.]|uniref:serine/threonine-protein kinase n=1 Tax=Amycolatopsis sp. TaxID=37632 RepID=UPI0026290C01|nr:serine/threonine-protein kinase [Amycolatopsis sp.]MCU1687709.1 serine/threonine protein kinase [Amycolatopsis sp.]
MTEEIRQIAGRYRLIEQIGGGAMGVVWRAEDRYLDRVVAIKELLLTDGQGEDKTAEAKNRAMREARIAARLQHPNAISVFSVVEDGDRPWLIMEYLPSKSLATALKERGTLPVDEVIGIACQLASALAAAHLAGVIHRDIKPGNVLLGEDGTVKVTDFGISRAIGDVTLTATGEIAGTPAFLAPEVAQGQDASFASDVFSLGSTLYTAVEGAPPFGYGDKAIALLYRVSSGEIVPPTKAARLEPLLLRLLQVDPQARPTMNEALADLQTLAAVGLVAPVDQPVPASDPNVKLASPAVVTTNRGRLVAVVAGIVLLVAVATAAALATRGSGNTGTAAPQASQAPVSAGLPNPPPATATSRPSVSPTTSPTSPTSPTTPSGAAAADTPEARAQALASYYTLLPGNLDAAFAKLTTKFKVTKSQTAASYASFYSRFSAVEVSGISAGAGNTVGATITFVQKSGGTLTEHDTFTMVQENGVWMIDAQSFG